MEGLGTKLNWWVKWLVIRVTGYFLSVMPGRLTSRFQEVGIRCGLGIMLQLCPKSRKSRDIHVILGFHARL